MSVVSKSQQDFFKLYKLTTDWKFYVEMQKAKNNQDNLEEDQNWSHIKRYEAVVIKTE